MELWFDRAFANGRALGTTVAAASLLFCSAAHADDAESIVKHTYRNAIVKIVVTSNTPVFVDGKNVCRSEGTGFLVNRTTTVSATHVLRLPSGCGAPVIEIRSYYTGWTSLARLVAGADDIAILTADPPPADSLLCSLVIAPGDVFDQDGFRYGIPEGLQEAEPLALHIGDSRSEFRPFTVITPSPIRPGNSGGPVLFKFNVIGVMKAMHEKYPEYGLMIRGETLRAVLETQSIRSDETSCNPAKWFLSGKVGKISLPSIRFDGLVGNVIKDPSSLVERLEKYSSFELDMSTLTRSKPSLEVRPKWSTTTVDQNKLELATKSVSDQLIDNWWKDYMSQLKSKRAP